jgi:hypothetical protein
MISGLDRKNCWAIVEHRGDTTPDGLQHLLARAKWDADAVRDDLRPVNRQANCVAGQPLRMQARPESSG